MITIDTQLQRIIEQLQDAGITLEQAAEAFEEKYVDTALRDTKGNVTRAARRIGVHRNTIHNMLRRRRGWRGEVS
jgi:DNA-binding NtrC family response regulator